jgi:hypothetical protein
MRTLALVAVISNPQDLQQALATAKTASADPNIRRPSAEVCGVSDLENAVVSFARWIEPQTIGSAARPGAVLENQGHTGCRRRY